MKGSQSPEYALIIEEDKRRSDQIFEGTVKRQKPKGRGETVE